MTGAAERALHKPSGVAAVFAQLFRCPAAVEFLHHFSCSFGVQNFLKLLCENITKGNDSVAVQTAGNHSAVGEDAEVVSQTVAEKAVPLSPVAVRPGKQCFGRPFRLCAFQSCGERCLSCSPRRPKAHRPVGAEGRRLW